MKKYDFIIIGSGFGGSVSAMRLSQKGYTVLLLEKGKRYNGSDFPKTNWNLKKFIWAPALRLFGIQQITLLNKIMILHGAGVGGGSLVYANTLMQPANDVLQSDKWPIAFKNTDRFYAVARKMLGVNPNKFFSTAETAMQKLAHELNVADTFHLAEVGVYFGDEKNISLKDPYFSGQGPSRTPCNGCGSCMIGCPVGAKNTLDKNYLYFAEKWGCEIKAESHVTKIEPVQTSPNNDSYIIHVKSSTALFSKIEKYAADKVIVSAGVIGTLKILFENKLKYKTLPKISEQLGQSVMTNGESLCGSTSISTDIDYSKGIAIGSAIHTDAVTKIEPVRYPAGSDFMRLLAVPLTENGSSLTRPLKLFKNIIFNFKDFYRLQFAADWAKQSIILLVMRSVEEKISVNFKRSFFSFGRKSLYCEDKDNTIISYMPIAQQASSKLATLMKGVPQNVISEVLLGIPATAHILGGCNFGDSSAVGVINDQFEVHGHKNLYVVDGSVIPVNLGVNPSLTITALAENFSEQFQISKNVSDSEFENRKIIFS